MTKTNYSEFPDHSLFSSHDSSDLVSDNGRNIFQWIFFVGVSEIMAVFGTSANIINIVCFVKQGFKDDINISLLGLALSDLGCLVPLIWTNICYNPAFNQLDLPFEPIGFQYLTGAWPHVVFTRITSWITAFIALERCLCISMPLKVKIIFTHRRVTLIIVFIFLILIINVFPVYYVNRLVWKFSPTRNKTLIVLVFTEEREITESVTFAICNVFVEFSAFFIVVVCILTLVFKLKEKSKWRQSIAHGQVEKEAKRHQKATKMVIVMSTLFISCFTPVCLIVVGMIIDPEFSMGGKYINFWISLCSIGFALESTNSAMNIFIYYYMTRKYRDVFHQLFGYKTIVVNTSKEIIS